MPDYFTIFDLPRSFDINLTDLEKGYFASQRRFHPDRLVGKSAAERQIAIAQSMLVNEAYEALKIPLKRAQHMLTLQGIKPDSVKPEQGLLMDIMERRESLMEAGSAKDIEACTHQNEMATKETLDSLSHAFGVNDMAKAAQLTMRLSYLVKLEDEIRIRKKTIAA